MKTAVCRIAPLALGLVLMGVAAVWAQSAQTIQKELKDTEVKGEWHYNDLASGLADAKRTGKPLLVVFR